MGRDDCCLLLRLTNRIQACCRKAETEADIIGIQLAARACFDPQAAVTVFQKLEEVGDLFIMGGRYGISEV